MLHNRLSSSLRDIFSTVGPSPSPSLANPSTPGYSTPVAGDRTSTHAPRLILLPASSPTPNPDDAGGRRTGEKSLLVDLIAATAHRSAAFFAEASVLVLVLGILDRYLTSHRIEPRWIAGAFLVALGLLAASVATDVSARRWLRAH